MRKLNDARRDWEQRHQSNSPFRVNAYGSSSSIGFDSMDGSPISATRGYGLRTSVAKGDQYNTAQAPLNLTNKQSSFYKNSKGKNSSFVGQSPMSAT